MKTFYRLYCFVLLFFLAIVVVNADYLKVSRSAYIYAEPNKNSKIIEQAKSGISLKLLDEGRQSNGYYRVQTISIGEPGWIYRALVRRYPGDIPEQTKEAQVIDPLADSTVRLTSEQQGYAARHLRLGKPQAVYERVREGYVLAQDARLKIPLWVQYELSPADLRGTANRTDDFRPDTSIPFGSRAELNDYRGSNFDRGHMAPAADMKRSQNVMSECFLLSNMAPQIGVGFNRDIWEELEAAVRGWVEQRGSLTIIIGPIFAVKEMQVSYKVIGNSHVAVPTYFYKIIVDTNDPNRMEALAFILPNENLSGHHCSEFLCSIDEIEKMTGLDFLSVLPQDVQEKVESRKADKIW